MKACVTGANGFIGRVLVKRIQNEFDQIRVLTRKKEYAFSVPNIIPTQGDLSKDDGTLIEFLEDCDIVFHCAGEIHNKELMKSLHIDGTKRLVQAVLSEAKSKNKKIHFVHLSSVGVYGKPDGGASLERIVTEASAINPNGEYEITKTESDRIVLNTKEEQFMTYSILRPSNVIGPHMPNQSFYKLASMIKKGFFFYIGKPNSIATYVHVNDVVEALLLCAKDPRAKGQIYNLSNDCSFEEVIEGIAKELKVRSPTLRLPEFLLRMLVKLFGFLPSFPLTNDRVDALVIRTKYPTHKIQSELSFSPRFSIPNSIADIIKDRSL